MKLCPTQLAKGSQKKNKSNLNILLFKMFVPFKFPKRYLIYLQCFSEIANISAQKRTNTRPLRLWTPQLLEQGAQTKFPSELVSQNNPPFHWKVADVFLKRMAL